MGPFSRHSSLFSPEDAIRYNEAMGKGTLACRPLRAVLFAWMAFLASSSVAQENSPAWSKNPDNVHGLALAEVVAGRPGEATQRLENALVGREEQPAWDALRREQARIAAWYELSSRFWDESIAEGHRLTLTVRRKTLKRVQITSRDEDGSLLLGSNKFGIRRFRSEELDPVEVAAQMGKASDSIRNDPARRWLQLLRGEGKARRWLAAGKDPVAVELAPDAARYEELLGRGEVLLGWLGIQGEIETFDPARVERELERLDRLREGSHPLFQELEGELRAGVERLLGRAIDLEGPRALVRGKLEDLGEERVRVTYEFDSEEERLDFLDSPTYLEHVHGRMNELAGKVRKPAFRQGEGFLEGIGAGCVRLDFPFEAPIKASWDVEYRPRKKQINPAALQFMVGVLDDGEGSYAGLMDFGNLEVAHGPSGMNKPDYNLDKRTNLKPKKRYAFEFTRDLDGKMVCVIDGDRVNEFTAVPRLRRGGVFLWVHSDMPVLVHRLTIEAQLPPSAYELRRTMLAREQMAARGW